MGDQVQTRIETMIPDLLRFVKQTIFTKKEVRQILKTRQSQEYSMLKRTAQLKDFIRAIEYEFQLVFLQQIVSDYERIVKICRKQLEELVSVTSSL